MHIKLEQTIETTNVLILMLDLISNAAVANLQIVLKVQNIVT